MKNKEGLEFGTEVNTSGDNATVYDVLTKNEAMIKLRMVTGPYKGMIMLTVLRRVNKGFC